MEKGSARDGLSARSSLQALFKIYYLLEDNCFAVGFCNTRTCFSLKCTYVPSLRNSFPSPHPTPLGCHRALAEPPVWYSNFPLAIYFVAVQSLSRVWLFPTPRTAAHQASLSFTISWSLLKFIPFESVMPSRHLILCCPLLLLPSIFLIIRAFSNESALRIRWPKYWSFSIIISPSSEYSGLISFRIHMVISQPASKEWILKMSLTWLKEI